MSTMKTIAGLKLLAYISGIPLWLNLGLLVAWLLGGADRDGDLNAWGLVIMMPFLFVGYVVGTVIITILISVPVIALVMTPFCVFVFDNSCIASLIHSW